MPTLRAQVRMPGPSLLPEDVYMNTFHFGGTDPTDLAACEAVHDLLFDFYATGTPSVADFLAETIVWDQASIRFYDLNDPEPRSPIAELGFVQNPSPVQANTLPQETALCLSFRAQYVSGAPPARRRGRVYLGPFNSGAVVLGAGDVPVPASDARDDRPGRGREHAGIRHRWAVVGRLLAH